MYEMEKINQQQENTNFQYNAQYNKYTQQKEI